MFSEIYRQKHPELIDQTRANGTWRRAKIQRASNAIGKKLQFFTVVKLESSTVSFSGQLGNLDIVATNSEDKRLVETAIQQFTALETQYCQQMLQVHQFQQASQMIPPQIWFPNELTCPFSMCPTETPKQEDTRPPLKRRRASVGNHEYLMGTENGAKIPIPWTYQPVEMPKVNFVCASEHVIEVQLPHNGCYGSRVLSGFSSPLLDKLLKTSTTFHMAVSWDTLYDLLLPLRRDLQSSSFRIKNACEKGYIVETSDGWAPNMAFFSRTNEFVSQTEALGSCSVLGEHLLANVKAYPGFQMSETVGSAVNLLTSIATIHPDNHERILTLEMIKAENSNQLLAVVAWLDSAIPAYFEQIPVKSRVVAVHYIFFSSCADNAGKGDSSISHKL